MTVSSRQMRAFTAPFRSGSLARPYVPFLLAKRGELRGLGLTSPEVRQGLTPWFRIVSPELRGSRDERAPLKLLNLIAGSAGEQAIYLDVAAVPRRDRKLPPLDASYVREHYEAALDAGVPFAPVYPFGRPDLAGEVSRFARQTGLGAAVHVDVERLAARGGTRLRAQLANELRTTGLNGSEVDLALDFGFLEHGPPDRASVKWVLEELLPGARFRSIIVAGTAIPQSAADVVLDGQLGGIRRAELDLFAMAESIARAPIRRADFGIQNPVPPAPSKATKMRTSLRFTAGAFTYIVRGSHPWDTLSRAERIEEYRTHASRIMLHPPYAQLADDCWAERQLELVADGRALLRSQEGARALGTCHHLSAEAIYLRDRARDATVVAEELVAPTDIASVQDIDPGSPPASR